MANFAPLLAGLAMAVGVVSLFSGCRQANRIAWVSQIRGLAPLQWPAGTENLTAQRLQEKKALSSYLAGLIAEGREDWAAAKEQYERAHRADPKGVGIWLHLGVVNMRLNDLPQAIDAFQTVLRWNPTDARARFLLGVLYASEGHFEEAAHQYAAILKEDPRNLGALSSLADLYLLQDKVEEGILIYERFLEERPDSAVAHFNAGVLYAKAQDWTRASLHLRKAVELDPGNLETRLGLGAALELDQKLAEAKEQYLAALEMEPANTNLVHHLGELSYQMGDLEEAASWFTRYLSFKPNEPTGYLELGMVQLDQGQWRQTIKLLKGALELQSGLDEAPVELWLGLGVAYQTGNQFEEAQRAYQKALGLEPQSPQALNSLGFLYAEWGIHLEEAADLISQALAQDPANGAYLDSLGWVYFKMGNLQEATKLLERAAEKNPDSEIFEHLSQVYSSIGHSQAAKSAHEKAKHPKDFQKRKDR